MILTTLLAINVGMTILVLLACKRTKKSFELLTYDHNDNDDESFYGSDELAMAYKEALSQNK